MKVIDRVEALSEDILKDNGCELIDIEFKKEGNNKVLRLYIERIEGKVSLDEISTVNRLLSDLKYKPALIISSLEKIYNNMK